MFHKKESGWAILWVLFFFFFKSQCLKKEWCNRVRYHQALPYHFCLSLLFLHWAMYPHLKHKSCQFTEWSLAFPTSGLLFIQSWFLSFWFVPSSCSWPSKPSQQRKVYQFTKKVSEEITNLVQPTQLRPIYPATDQMSKRNLKVLWGKTYTHTQSPFTTNLQPKLLPLSLPG